MPFLFLLLQKIIKKKYKQPPRSGHLQSVPIKQDDRCGFLKFCFVFTLSGLLDGNIHHVQGPHWKKRVSCRLDGHEHGSEQVSCHLLPNGRETPAVPLKNTGRDKVGTVSAW